MNFETSARSTWLPQGAFEATVRWNGLRKGADSATVRSKRMPAKGFQGHCTLGSLRGQRALRMAAHRWFAGHCALEMVGLEHRGADSCICATTHAEKLFQASMLGFTEPCITSLCCILNGAWICMGSHQYVCINIYMYAWITSTNP